MTKSKNQQRLTFFKNWGNLWNYGLDKEETAQTGEIIRHENKKQEQHEKRRKEENFSSTTNRGQKTKSKAQNKQKLKRQDTYRDKP